MKFASCSVGAKDPEPGLRAPHEIDMRGRSLRGCGRRQPNWRARCSALALALLAAGSVPLVSGCGPVEFVPSPYTPQKVELIYSAQEDITIVRWRVSSGDPANADLHFELLGNAGYEAIDFSQSVFPGGGTACGDGTGACFQYVVRGRYATSSQWDRPVQAVHATYGVLPGGLPSTATLANTVTFTSYFHAGNDAVYLNITDAVASDGIYDFPRTYNRTMWPTKGLCVSDAAPDGVEFSPLDSTGGFAPPSPLSDDGIYCVAIEPIPSDGGDAAMVQNRVATLPEVTTLQVTYAPPVEESPVIYQIVFDLSIPVGSRCMSAIPTIENLVDQAMQSSDAPYYKFPTINLALDPSKTDGTQTCTQQNSRTLDADGMAEAVKEKAAQFPQKNQQFHFFYFNNVNFVLPPMFTDSLQRLFADLSTPPPGQDLMTISWLFNPGVAASTGPKWTMTQPWQSADDTSLKMTLMSYAQETLPFQSQIQDPSVPIRFLSDAQASMYAGGSIKICNYSTPQPPLPVDMTNAQPLGPGPSWPIDGSDPPGFLIDLATEANEPASNFVEAGILMTVQVCTRFCTDHPYVSTGGNGVVSWAPSPFCAGDQ